MCGILIWKGQDLYEQVQAALLYDSRGGDI